MDLFAMLAGGFLGSGHCIGMCGGFALTIGETRPRLGAVLLVQLVYSAGRLFTYGFLGALGGLLGARLAGLDLPLIGAQQALAIVAGVMMLLIGLSNLGLLRLKRLRIGFGGELLASLLRHFINSRGVGPYFLAGVFTGFLPCGLVYTFLALAVARGDPVQGWLMMVCFGAGTIPAMVSIGCGSRLLSRTMRLRTQQVAACFVILLGVATVYRGLPIGGGHCHAHAQSSGATDCCETPDEPADAVQAGMSSEE